jgi:hypothetical protein
MTYQGKHNLKANPKRQAIPALRGYSFQIWHSVLQWINLGDNEVLFLEGAEDIDLLALGAAETIQVKETKESGSVTLRSPAILDAVTHFWEHRKNNHNYRIKFRFLTTSVRGMENPPIINGVRGLDYWDQCKRPVTDIQPLRDFLRQQNVFSQDLREFMTVSSDENFREQIIRCIEWDTGQGQQAWVEEQIERKIILHGVNVHSLQPSESQKVIPHLLRKVWDVVCQKENRRLYRSDFLR